MQLRHAIGLRSLPAHDTDHITVELARVKSHMQLLLRIKHSRRRLDDMAVIGHGRHLDHAAPQVTLQQLEAAAGTERLADGPHDGLVFRGAHLMPGQLAIDHCRLACVLADAACAHCQHILVHEAAIEQLADHKAGAPRRLELVHIGAAVGVHMGQQRHHIRQGRKIIPVDHDARRPRHRHPVNQVVGGAAGGQQRHHRVDDCPLINNAAYRCKTL